MPRTPAPVRTPLLAFLAGLAALAAVVVVPAGRAFLEMHVIPPLAAQALGHGGGGYSPVGLAFWALVGVWLAVVAWTGVVKPLDVPTDLRLAWALAPFLVWGPLAHALLQTGAYAEGALIRWLVAEPVVYLTTAVLALAGLAAGALASRRHGFAWPPAAGVGVLALLALAPALSRAVTARGAAPGAAAVIALASLALALVVAGAARILTRVTPRFAPLGGPAGAGVVGAHALDGLSTWIILRDPFGWGFGGFAEKNPFANALVSLGNGWPFPLVKVLMGALLVVLVWQATEDPGERAFRAPAALALFALGWGPGAANLLLVALGS